MAALPSIEATSPGQALEVRQFLAGIFGRSEDAYFLSAPVFAWKSFAARPGWPEPSRSYVIRYRGRIASHGCVWPFTLLTAAGRVSALQIIDWGAAGDVMPGAGALLRRQIVSRLEVGIGVGGSPDARRVMPRDGYIDRAAYRSLALVVRPWQQLRRTWSLPVPKRFARLLRNTLWSCQGWWRRRRQPEGWRVEPVAVFDESMVAQPEAARPFIGCARSAALLNFILDYPGFTVKGARLFNRDRVMGHFLWCHLQGQSRIIDFQVNSPEPADWGDAALAATAAVLARGEAEACELAVFLSLPLAIQAFEDLGYRVRKSEPLFVRDPGNRLDPRLPLHITAIEFDGFYLHSPDSPFLT